MSDEPRTFDELLDSVPTPSRAVRAEPSSLHGTVLRVPVRRRWYMRPPMGWLLPFQDHRSLALDPLGREVWEMCDGRNTTETVIDRFSRAHYVSFHEARVAVTQYLQLLTRNGLIAMVGLRGRGGRP